VFSGIASSVAERIWFGLKDLLLLLALVLGLRQFLLEARYIPSGSMLPGLQVHDRLMVDKLTNRFRSPQRGEIIVFNAPHAFDPVLKSTYQSSPIQCFIINLPLLGALTGIQTPACDAYIKRVVAISGDRVIVDPKGFVKVNGIAITEPYVTNFCSPIPCKPLQTVVPPESVLVLGDNRANSWDGRLWPGTNFVPNDQIIGRALFRFWPFKSFGSLLSPDPGAKPLATANP